jgi:outer membrane protein assembly factor BamA
LCQWRFTRFFLLLLFGAMLIARPCFASMPLSYAPEIKKDTSFHTFVERAKTYRQLDLIDVVKLVLHRRLMSTSDSVTKDQKLQVSVLPAPGFTQTTGVLGILSGNFAFFVDNKHNINQSNLSLNIDYTQKRQAIFAIHPNIWTPNDEWNITGDNRIMKYPQETFGLGGHTLPDNGYTIDYFLVRVRETVLRHVIQNLYAGFGYDFDYHFNIKQVTANLNTDYDIYGGGTKSVSSGPKVEVEYDSRRNAINPVAGGFYASIIYSYYFKALGSDNNYSSLKGDFRAYIPLSKNKKHILALWNYDWFTFNDHAPYLDLPSTGWDDPSSTGRGYIQARYRGKNFLDLEAEYRFPILRDGFFSGVIFANVESVTDYPSNKFTTAAPGWGCGLRVKLNKNSGTNLCFDYGFGLHHSNDFVINIGELF